MKSKTSFCNGTLLRKNLTRFWPLWTLFTLGLLLFFFSPMRQAARAYQEYYGSLLSFNADDAGDLVGYHVMLGVFATLSYAIVCAVCCFSYLHKTRSAYMLHAFPVTRAVLFRTNALSGLLFFLVPWTAVIGLEMLVALPAGLFVRTLLRSYLLVCMEYLFFYGLAVACMHITGKTVYGILSYLALNFLFVVLEVLLYEVLEPLLPGMSIGDYVVTFLSPAIELLRLGTRVSYHCMSELWLYCGIAALLGATLLAAAWFLYRARRMESCGETIAFRFARPIFQYLLALLGALLLGILALAVSYGEIYVGGTIFITLIFLLLGGLVGYFGAEMMLRRSIRVFQARAWVGFAAFAAVLVGGLMLVRYDALHIVRHVPDSDEIVSVELTSLGATMVLTDEADIESFRSIHADWAQTCLKSGISSPGYGDATIAGHSFCVSITYHLKDGDTLNRQYTFWDSAGDNSYDRLATLLTQAELSRDAFARVLEGATEIEVEYDNRFDELNGFDFSQEQMQALRQCIYADAEAGNLAFFYTLAEEDYAYYRLSVYREKDVTDQIKVLEGYSLTIPSSATQTIAYLESLSK